MSLLYNSLPFPIIIFIHVRIHHGFWHFHFRPHSSQISCLCMLGAPSVSLICTPTLAIHLMTSDSLWHATTYHSALQSIAPSNGLVHLQVQHCFWHFFWSPWTRIVPVWLVGVPCVNGLLTDFDHPLCDIQHPLTRHNMTIYLVILCSFKPCHLLKSPNLQLLVEILGLA